MAGYHLVDIAKGQFGRSSKIAEEVEELLDAERQGVKVMVLCELSDLYGAIRGYLAVNHPGVTMTDLEDMADVTQRAFESGARS